MIKPLLTIFLLLSLVSCGGGGGGDSSSSASSALGERSFRMGLTPFAKDLTLTSAQTAWNLVYQHGDLVALHFDTVDGLPWADLEAGNITSPFRDRFDYAASQLKSGSEVYVGINPLNAARDGISLNYGGGPFPLGAADFSNPRLHTAFINYARFIVNLFNPQYLAIGLEVNMFDLPTNPNRDFADFVLFYKTVYQNLKASYPNLNIFPTFQTEFMHGFDQWNLIALFEPELDRIGASLYPSSQGFEPNGIPANWLSRFTATQSQPLLVAETGYGSRPFSGSFSAPGSETLQQEYVNWLVGQAENLNMDFLVWFFPSDTPNLTIPNGIPPGLASNLSFYYYMGLVTENYIAKPVLTTWDNNLDRPYTQ